MWVKRLWIHACGVALTVGAVGLCPGVSRAATDSAQNPSIVSLVPAANWQLTSSEKLDVNAVSKWGGDPAVDREYGVKSIEHRTYELVDKTADAIIEEGPDASAAYGLFTYYRTESMAPDKSMVLTVSGGGDALMARNRFFIRVVLHSGAHVSPNEMRALLIVIGGTRPSTDVRAVLPAALPVSPGMVPGCEKYLLGPEATRHVLPSLNPDLIGFNQGAEVQVASYQTGARGAATASNNAEKRAALVAISYPTPQIAMERFGNMENALAINQDRGTQSVFGKRKGSFVILAMNADPTAAKKLLAQFTVSEQISWDQPYPKKPVVWQMVKLVIANFFLAFILAGFAVIGGIVIALSRRAAAKWFPGLEWGNPDSESLITLKLR
jgi:hypothetical protein